MNMDMDRIEERKNKQRSLIIQFSYCIPFLSFLFFFLTQKGVSKKSNQRITSFSTVIYLISG